MLNNNASTQLSIIFNKISTAFIVFWYMSLIGCASIKNPQSQFGLSSTDNQTLAAKFKDERIYMNGKVPTLGLALSGGGTKAAVFAHGVLHGLQDTGLLDQVDAISSVSGGGYAAFWYYSKLMERQNQGFSKEAIFQDCFPLWWKEAKLDVSDQIDDKKLKQAFNAGRESAKESSQVICGHQSHTKIGIEGDPFRWQAHLLRWPDLFRTKITPVNGSAQKYPFNDSVHQFLSVLFELTVGWTGIESDLPRNYQYGIERTWGLNPVLRTTKKAQNLPEEDIWTYTNALNVEGSNKVLRMDPEKMTWQGLKDLYDSTPQPPLWILNTTQGNKGNRPDMGNLYELTPFGHGSTRLGYKTGTPPKEIDSIAKGVRASAAFIDSQGISEKGKKDRLNWLAKFVPAARWGVRIKLEDNEGNKRKVRLSDGGGTDNLGLISLVRRGLSDIIVVDAGEDVMGVMDDLCWAKVALQQEELTMTFEPTLANFEKLCNSLYPREKDKGVSQNSPEEKDLAYNISDWMNPVVQGTIEWGDTGRKTNIWLIKAAWNQNMVRQAYNSRDIECGNTPDKINCFLMLYYGHNSTITVEDAEDEFMIFPQHGTASATVNGSSYMMLAYRELGRMLAAHLERDADQNIRIKEGRGCIQPSLKRVRKHRPGPRPNVLDKIPTKCNTVPIANANRNSTVFTSKAR